MSTNSGDNFTEGSILRSLVILSLPIIFTNILQTAYQLTDTFWVGRLGAMAVASVSISFPIIFFTISLGGGLAMAGTILVAQYKGKNSRQAINHIASQTLLIVVFISVILAVIGYLLSPWLISLIGAEPDVFAGAVSYIKISFIGMIFVFIYMVVQALFRGVGEVKVPMYIVLTTVLLNLALDPLFIFGWRFIPAFGVAGAAVATISTQGLAALIGFWLLFRGKYKIQLRLIDLKPDWVLIKKMFRIGLPASVEQSTRALGMIIMAFLVATFGTIILAAYGIGVRVLSFIIIPALSLSIATSILVGQNIGAGKVKRAEEVVKLSSLVGFVSLTVIGLIIFIFAKDIAAIFVPGEPEVIRQSSLFIRMMSLTFGFIGIQMSLNGLFRGSGNTLTSMMLSIISLWVLRFPFAYILSNYTSLQQVGLWLAFPLESVLGAVIAVVWFKRGNWKNRRITEEIKLKEKTVDEVIIEEGMNN